LHWAESGGGGGGSEGLIFVDLKQESEIPSIKELISTPFIVTKNNMFETQLAM
jgi:hypothetical protein